MTSAPVRTGCVWCPVRRRAASACDPRACRREALVASRAGGGHRQRPRHTPVEEACSGAFCDGVFIGLVGRTSSMSSRMSAHRADRSRFSFERGCSAVKASEAAWCGTLLPGDFAAHGHGCAATRLEASFEGEERGRHAPRPTLLTCGAALPPDCCKNPHSLSMQQVSELRLYSRVAHHPWRDRNTRTFMTSRASASVAHHPWRDRNTGPNVHPYTASVVAHHPWRDRNNERMAASPPPGPGRSSPLEGSQHTQGTAPGGGEPGSLITPGGIATLGAAPAAGVLRAGRSSPLEGSQLTGSSGSAVGRVSRSSPLEGSQHDQVGVLLPARVAHHPWRDRNDRYTSRKPIRSCRSSPLEGSQHDQVGVLLPARVAHHPWRDRNRHTRSASRNRPTGRSSPLEGSQQPV